MKISVAVAKNRLPELIKSVEAGEIVTICRRGLPVVDIVPTKASTIEKPKFGSLRGRIAINDESWWHEMSEDETQQFIDGTY
jgi:prevent-host-death family protein